MSTRRDFIHGIAAAVGGLHAGAAEAAASSLRADDLPKTPPAAATGSDVGSLFPFIQSQAVHGEFPLSYLRDEFRDLAAWKARARGKFVELLHYEPPHCEPRPEVIERVDCDGYVRERIVFNTT